MRVTRLPGPSGPQAVFYAEHEGEVFQLDLADFQEPQKQQAIVILCDTSGSMQVHIRSTPLRSIIQVLSPAFAECRWNDTLFCLAAMKIQA